MTARTAILVFLPAIGLVTASAALARPRLGIEAGVNVSSFDYYNGDAWEGFDSDWRPSFTGGVMIQFPFRGRFALTTGLRYLQEGNHLEYSNDLGNGRITLEVSHRQHYLAVPIRLDWYPFAARRLFLSAGPEVGFLVSGRLAGEYTRTGAQPSHLDFSNDMGEYMEPVIGLIGGGAGTELPWMNHTGVLQLRFSYSVTSAAKKDRWVSDWDTQGIEFLAGLRW